MRGRGSVRSSSASSLAGIAVCLILICPLGILGFEQPGAWVVVALLMVSVVYNLANLASEEGVPDKELSFQIDDPLPVRLEIEPLPRSFAPDTQSPAARLRALDQLHGEGLLTDDEFLAKREQILAEL